MRKIFLIILCVLTLVSLTGCKENTLNEEDILLIIEENSLNFLNEDNCGYKGEEAELDVENIVIEKSNIFKDDASADAKVELKGDDIKVEFYYRFDLAKEKKVWKLKDFKNYKSYVIIPLKGVDNEEALEILEDEYFSEYTFTIKSNEFDEKEKICKVKAEFIKENDISKSKGVVDIKYIFDEKTLKWVYDSKKESVTDTEEFNPEGQWRFNDDVYFYRIDIKMTDDETAQINSVVSEYESVVDTAEFEQSAVLSITPNDDRLYIEPFMVQKGEEKINVMLYLDNSSLYFCTDYMSEYKKANLSRYTDKTY